jgi:uncharacterized protein YbjQ (UPF0145 family)
MKRPPVILATALIGAAGCALNPREAVDPVPILAEVPAGCTYQQLGQMEATVESTNPSEAEARQRLAARARQRGADALIDVTVTELRVPVTVARIPPGGSREPGAPVAGPRSALRATGTGIRYTGAECPGRT